MKKRLAILFLMLGALVVGPWLGQAQALSLGGFGGPVAFDISGLESSAIYPAGTICGTAAACAAVPPLPVGTGIPGGKAGPVSPFPAGETSWGIFNIDKITDPSTLAVLWLSGDAGEFLHGIFYNSQDYSVTSAGSVQTISAAGVAGGNIFLDVYLSGAPGLAGLPGARTGPGTYPTFTGGALALSLMLIAGADAVDPLAQLSSTFNLATSSGDARAFADITGGSLATMFSAGLGLFTTNQGGPADVKLIINTDPANPLGTVGGSEWTVRIQDPAFAVAVPQPASLVLLGLSLLGLAGLGLRRQK